MLDGDDGNARALAEGWLTRFRDGLAAGDLSGLFIEDAHWRDLVALTGEMNTTSGDRVPAALAAAIDAAGAHGFQLHSTLVAPQTAERSGRSVIEAGYAFETPVGTCEGLLRLLPMSEPPDAPQCRGPRGADPPSRPSSRGHAARCGRRCR